MDRLDKAQFRSPELRKAVHETALKMTQANLAYSREHVREADLLGAELAIRAGGTTHGVAEFFRREDSWYQESVKGLDEKQREKLRNESTHPTPQERMKCLEALLGRTF